MNSRAYSSTITLLFLLLAACATKISDLRHDTSFNFQAVSANGIWIGGVVSSAADLPDAELADYAELMRSKFQEERKNFHIVNHGAIVSGLGAARYAEIMREYKNTGTLTASRMDEIRNGAKDTRYVAMARIITDSVLKNRRQENLYDSKDKDRKQPIGYKTTSTAERKMAVALSIYDLEMKKEVWGGTVEKSREDSKTYENRSDTDLSVLVNVMDAITKDEDARFPYPPDPRRGDVLSSIFSGFGENLPEPSK